MKDKEGKLPYYTVLYKQFPNAIESLVKRSVQGHIKYAKYDHNWDNFKSVEPEEYLNAALRHLKEPNEIDKELVELTGQETTHAEAALWNLVAYVEIIKTKKIKN